MTVEIRLCLFTEFVLIVDEWVYIERDDHRHN